MPDFMPTAQPITTSDHAELSDLDDRALLEAHLTGDRDAFAVLARRYRALMLFIAQRIVRELADPEDVVQSALLGVFRSAASFDHRASMKTWIGRITRNAAFDARRRRLARPTCAEIATGRESYYTGAVTERLEARARSSSGYFFGAAIGDSLHGLRP